MPFIDMHCLQKTCRVYPSLDRVTLREAIYGAYEMWFEDVECNKSFIFHAYFGLSLLAMGIDDLFEAERYRKGIGHYFNQRAVAKLARMREVLKNSTSGPVEVADATFVRIRATDAVSFEFGVIRGVRPAMRLKWSHVEELSKIIRYGDGSIEDEDRVRHHARRQALAVMNDKRALPARRAA